MEIIHKGMEEPIKEILYSYRGWHVDSITKLLKPISLTAITASWTPLKALKANCSMRYPRGGFTHHYNTSPQWYCECGYYSSKSISDLNEAYNITHFNVIGKIANWGKIIECEKGFRTEFAYPQVLYYLNPEQIASRYFPKTEIIEIANNYCIDAEKMPENLYKEYYHCCKNPSIFDNFTNVLNIPKVVITPPITISTTFINPKGLLYEKKHPDS